MNLIRYCLLFLALGPILGAIAPCRINVLDADSDNDRLADGTERGVSAEAAPTGTDLSAGRFIPDADPAPRTSMVLADTARGGAADGTRAEQRSGGEGDQGAAKDFHGVVSRQGGWRGWLRTSRQAAR